MTLYEERFFNKLKKSDERIASFLLRDKFKRTYSVVGQNCVYLTSDYLVQQI